MNDRDIIHERYKTVLAEANEELRYNNGMKREDLSELLDTAELLIKLEDHPALSDEIRDEMNSLLAELTGLLKDAGWVRDGLTGEGFVKE